MPLDPRKIAHIQALLPRVWAFRQQPVVFVYNTAGSYSYVAQMVIFRPLEVIDPQIPNLSGQPPGIPTDRYLLAPLTTNVTGVVFVADTGTATASAVASAPKYEIIEAVPTGIVPGGTHLRVALRRMR